MSIGIYADHVGLSSALAAHALIAEDEEPVLPLAARRTNPASPGEWQPITVTAILERTAAFYVDGDKYNTGVLRLDLVGVDPTTITWRTKIIDRFQKTTSKARWNGARIGSAAASNAASRKRSDDRALANREQVERQLESERQQLAAQRVSASIEPAAGAFERELMSQAKTCRVCGKDKPRDSFPKTGRNAQRCYSCAETAALTVTTTPIKSAPKSQPVIPVESVPVGDVVKHASVEMAFGKADLDAADLEVLADGFKGLLAEVKRLRDQRDGLRRNLELMWSQVNA